MLNPNTIFSRSVFHLPGGVNLAVVAHDAGDNIAVSVIAGALCSTDPLLLVQRVDCDAPCKTAHQLVPPVTDRHGENGSAQLKRVQNGKQGQKIARNNAHIL